MTDNHQILIVDDSEHITKMLTLYLQSKGYRCSVCSESSMALDELESGQYSACMLDINMPGLTGLEILKSARRNDSLLTSIIMMTSDESIETIIEVMRLGANDYLRKPFNLAEMKLTLDKAIQTYRLRTENARYKIHLEREVLRKTADIIKAFADSLEVRDLYTGGHGQRVSEIAFLIGQAMALSTEKLLEIKIGGLLHDIGKIGISDSILKKPGKLTTEEYSEMKRHPSMGADILKPIDSVNVYVPYVLYHHERFDGTGYPYGLKGAEIPIEGRILCVADAFDAMTSKRTYRDSWNEARALEEIFFCSGSQFDPSVVAIFKKLWTPKIRQKSLNMSV